jgi:hypothetical protein
MEARVKAAAEVCEAALSGDASALEARVKRLDAIKKALDDSPPRLTADWIAAVCVSLICLSATGVLWVTPTRYTQFSLDVQTEATTFQLAKEWRSPAIATHTIRAENIDLLRAPGLGLSLGANRMGTDCSLDTTATSGQLEVGAPEKSRIHIERTGSTYEIAVSDATPTSSAMVSGIVRISAACLGVGEKFLRESLRVDVPETIELVSKEKSIIPVRLVFTPGQEWTVTGLKLNDSLSFLIRQPSAGGDDTFSSAITSGRITIRDAQTDYQIRRSEALTFKGLSTDYVQLTLSSAGLNVKVEGKAENILLGPVGSARELKPSYLAYLYFNKTALFFATAVTLGWGVLWGIRKTIFR